jgi:Domain of unknown function (DUF4129)
VIRCCCLALVVAAVWFSQAVPALAQPPVVPLPEFVADIERLVGAVRAAETAAAAAAIAPTVPERWRVSVGTQTVDVHGQWLTVALLVSVKKPDGWTAARTDILRRLSEIREQAATVAAAPDPGTRARARAALADVLDRDEFRRSAASRWFEELRRRIGAWLEDLFERIGAGPGAGRRAAIVLAWVATIGALIGLGVLLARSLGRSGGPLLDVGAQAGLRPRARELALRAVAEARAGRPREAVRLAYNAALARFEEDGVWRIDAARTPREYLPMLRAGDARRPLLLDLTQRFERIWYGNRPVADDDASRVTAHLEELGCLRPGERVI